MRVLIVSGRYEGGDVGAVVDVGADEARFLMRAGVAELAPEPAKKAAKKSTKKAAD